MKPKYSVDRMLIGMRLPGEIPPGLPLVEIVGNSRVLIENHLGVCSYCSSGITVKVCKGLVQISGESLELQQMTKLQLVITGVIFGVSLKDWR